MGRYVEYILVNKDLEMSVGKIAGQVAYAQAIIDNKIDFNETKEYGDYVSWFHCGQKKIILKAKESQLLKAIEFGGLEVRDHGLTEIEPNSLTVVGFLPKHEEDNDDSDFKKFVKRLQLL